VNIINILRNFSRYLDYNVTLDFPEGNRVIKGLVYKPEKDGYVPEYSDIQRTQIIDIFTAEFAVKNIENFQEIPNNERDEYQREVDKHIRLAAGLQIEKYVNKNEKRYLKTVQDYWSFLVLKKKKLLQKYLSKQANIEVGSYADKLKALTKPVVIPAIVTTTSPIEPLILEKDTQKIKPIINVNKPKPPIKSDIHGNKIPYLNESFKHPLSHLDLYKLGRMHLSDIPEERKLNINKKGAEILATLVKASKTHEEYMKRMKKLKNTPFFKLANYYSKRFYPLLNKQQKTRQKSEMLYQISLLNRNKANNTAVEWILLKPKLIIDFIKRNAKAISPVFEKLSKKTVTVDPDDPLTQKRLQEHSIYLSKAKKWFDESLDRIANTKYSINQGEHLKMRKFSVYYFPEYLKSRQANFHMANYIKHYLPKLCSLVQKRAYAKALTYCKTTFLPYKIPKFVHLYNCLVHVINSNQQLKRLKKYKATPITRIKVKTENALDEKLLKYCAFLKYVVIDKKVVASADLYKKLEPLDD